MFLPYILQWHVYWWMVKQASIDACRAMKDERYACNVWRESPLSTIIPTVPYVSTIIWIGSVRYFIWCLDLWSLAISEGETCLQRLVTTVPIKGKNRPVEPYLQMHVGHKYNLIFNELAQECNQLQLINKKASRAPWAKGKQKFSEGSLQMNKLLSFNNPAQDIRVSFNFLLLIFFSTFFS